MTPEQKAAFVNAQSVAATAEICGMIALNKERERNGYALAYGEDAFAAVPEKYGLGYNQLCDFFRD